MPSLNKIKTAILLIGISISLASLLTPKQALAVLGGRVITTITCTCVPGSLWLTVGPPRAGSFIYLPGASVLYSYYLMRPGNWVLGSTFPGGACLVASPTGCTPIGYGRTINLIGTSLHP